MAITKQVKETSRFQKARKAFLGQMKNIKNFAIFSPENPMGRSLSRDENEELRSQFEELLKRGHYNFYPIKGKYGNIENSYFIYNVNVEDVMRWGSANGFNQESFFICVSLYDEDARRTGVEFNYYKKDGDNKPFKLIETSEKWFDETPKDIASDKDDYFSVVGIGNLTETNQRYEMVKEALGESEFNRYLEDTTMRSGFNSWVKRGKLLPQTTTKKMVMETIDGSMKDILQLKTLDSSLEYSQMFDALSECPKEFNYKLIQVLNSVGETLQIPPTDAFNIVLCGTDEVDVRKKMYNWWRAVFEILSKCDIPEERKPEYDEKVDALMSEIAKGGDSAQVNEAEEYGYEQADKEDEDAMLQDMEFAISKIGEIANRVQELINFVNPYCESNEVMNTMKNKINESSHDFEVGDMVDWYDPEDGRVYHNFEITKLFRSSDEAEIANEDEGTFTVYIEDLEPAQDTFGESDIEIDPEVKFVPYGRPGPDDSEFYTGYCPWCGTQVEFHKSFLRARCPKCEDKIPVKDLEDVRDADGNEIPYEDRKAAFMKDIEDTKMRFKKIVKEHEHYTDANGDTWDDEGNLVGRNGRGSNSRYSVGNDWDGRRHSYGSRSGGYYSRHNWGHRPMRTSTSSSSSSSTIPADKLYFGKTPKSEAQAVYFLFQAVSFALGKKSPEKGEKSKDEYLKDINEFASYLLGGKGEGVAFKGDLDGLRKAILDYYKQEKGSRDASKVKDEIRKGNNCKSDPEFRAAMAAKKDDAKDEEDEKMVAEGDEWVDMDDLIGTMMDDGAGIVGDEDEDEDLTDWDGIDSSEDDQKFLVGRDVYFTDPDGGVSSGVYTVDDYDGELYHLVQRDENGEVIKNVEAFEHELKPASETMDEAHVIEDVPDVWALFRVLEDEDASNNLKALLDSHVRTEEEIMDTIDELYPEQVGQDELNRLFSTGMEDLIDVLGLDVNAYVKDGSFVDLDEPSTIAAEGTEVDEAEYLEFVGLLKDLKDATIKGFNDGDDDSKIEVVKKAIETKDATTLNRLLVLANANGVGEDNPVYKMISSAMPQVDESEDEAQPNEVKDGEKKFKGDDGQVKTLDKAEDTKMKMNEMTVSMEIQSVDKLVSLLWAQGKRNLESLLYADVMASSELFKYIETYFENVENLTEVNDALSYDFDDFLGYIGVDVDTYDQTGEFVLK